MKKIAICLLMLLLMSFSGFSQRIILIDTDTMVAFNKRQAAFLLNQTFRVREQDSIIKFRTQRLFNYQQRVTNDSLNIRDLKQQVANGQELWDLERGKNLVLTNHIAVLGRSIRRQKIGKFVAIGLGVFATYGGYRVGRMLR